MAEKLIEITEEAMTGSYVVDGGDPAAMSAVRKISGKCAPGMIIPLTSEEFAAIKRGLIRLVAHEQLS